MNHQTVLDRCSQLAQFSEQPGVITRTYLSPPMRQVHEQVRKWMTDGGMSVRIDAIGNIIGHLPGPTPDAPLVLIGSHLDTVPNAGKFDGILGVMLGISAVEQLRGSSLPFAIEVIGFSEEEGVRFATPYLGSRAIAGKFDNKLLDLQDAGEISLKQAITNFGLDPKDIPNASYKGKKILAYLEAHIEQGPVLGSMNLPVGVISAIAGQSKLKLKFTGRAAHAGTTPMDQRQDALVATAQLITEMQRIARSHQDLVATVGQLTVKPGATNVIPAECEFSLDVRHANDAKRSTVLGQILGRARQIADERNVTFDILTRADQQAVPMDESLNRLLMDTIKEQGVEIHRFVSGAGHDAAIMASLCPVTMLMLNNLGGVSHHPEESVPEDAVRTALSVMVSFVKKLWEEV